MSLVSIVEYSGPQNLDQNHQKIRNTLAVILLDLFQNPVMGLSSRQTIWEDRSLLKSMRTAANRLTMKSSL